MGKLATTFVENTTPAITRGMLMFNPATGQRERLTIDEFFQRFGIVPIAAGIPNFLFGLDSDADILTDATFKPLGDTAVGDLGAVGRTSVDGLIATGQGSTNDFVIKNDTDAIALSIPTGTQIVDLSTGGAYFGTRAAANLFDDYEEGTFTPEVADAAAAGNEASGGTFTGTYTKKGREVTCIISLLDIATVGMTAGNDVFVRALPFTNSAIDKATGSIKAVSLTFATGSLGLRIQASAAYTRIQNSRTGAGLDTIIVSDISSGVTDIFMTFTYFT